MAKIVYFCKECNRIGTSEEKLVWCPNCGSSHIEAKGEN